MAESNDFRVAIIGGGIIGIIFAHALIARSVPVQVYEQSSEVRTTGGGINAPQVGVRALKRCSKECYEAFKEVSRRHHSERPELFWSVVQDDKVVEVISKEEYGSRYCNDERCFQHFRESLRHYTLFLCSILLFRFETCAN